MTLRHLAVFMADVRGGGAERMMVNLVNGLAARGVRVEVVLAEAVGPYLGSVGDRVTIVDLRRRGVLPALPGLVRYLRRERPQALVSTLDHATAVAMLAVQIASVPTRHFIREANTPSEVRPAPFDLRGRAIQALMSVAYRRARGVLSVSSGVADDLVRLGRAPRDKIGVLFNPVVTRDVPQRAAESTGHPWFDGGSNDVILGVGRLFPQKRFGDLIRAFAIVRRHRPARLVILGEGPERVALEALIRELGLEDSVQLPGFVVNPFAYMARASVFVLSSGYEGLPGALIQAMACGCPVVATDCRSGPAEILEGGRLGTLVEVGDITAMAGAIFKTLERPPDRSATRAASARYGAERVTDAYLEFLEARL